MASFSAGTTFTDGVANDVTAAKLAALVNAATPTSGFIQDRTSETTIASNDTLLFGDASASDALKRITVSNLFKTDVSITSATGTAGTVAIGPTGDTNTGLFFPAADTIAFSEGGAEAMRINSSGNVGIGTGGTAAASKLDVYGDGHFQNIEVGKSGQSGNRNAIIDFTGDDTYTDYGFRIIRQSSGPNADTYLTNRGTGNVIVESAEAGQVLFNTNSTTRLTVNSSGNVGIGTTSPATQLQINSSATTYSDQLRIRNTNYGNADIGVGSGIMAIATDNSNIAFYTSSNLGTTGSALPNNERLRIDSSGTVGIGTTSPSAKLSISFNGTSVAGSNLINTDSGSSGQNYAIFYRNTTTQIGSITGTGSAISYNTSSDYRLKTNLDPVVNGIERIKQLPVYRFNWINDQGANKVDGFVAHEAKSIVPESVVGDKDAVDEEGNPIYQGIDQSKIVPLLTAALKEAIAKIETLEAKVAALEAA